MKFTILHEENSFLVINKPTGLLSQSTYGVESVLAELKSLNESKGGDLTYELPHRLDRGTSGLLLVAKTKNALRHLGDQFHFRKTRKAYLVAVESCPDEPSGSFVDRLKKIPNIAKAERVADDDPEGREAILHFERVLVSDRFSVHRVVMETGRMHQIRLQFALRGFPVLGDLLYGSSDPWFPTRRHDHDEHFALHASLLAFRHPKDGREIEFQAPLPEAWKQRFPEL
jgi:RluA family pseudouridine synthase